MLNVAEEVTSPAVFVSVLRAGSVLHAKKAQFLKDALVQTGWNAQVGFCRYVTFPLVSFNLVIIFAYKFI